MVFSWMVETSWWLLGAILFVPAVIVWMYAVVDLMIRYDGEFRGRFDKLAWAILLTFTGVFGALVYLICRPRGTFADTGSPDDESEGEEPWTCMQCGTTLGPRATRCSSCGWSYSESKTA